MIPAMRNLHDTSDFSSAESDQYMQEADSALGKRFSRGQASDDLNPNQGAMVVHAKRGVGNKQKRGKIQQSGKGKNQDEEKMDSDNMDGVEATGLGAAGKLTGSGAPPRQEQ